MQDENGKDIGKVVESDFNNTPGKLNDVSDIDIGQLQYTSPIVEKMKADGVYSNLCHLVRSIKFADKSDSFLCSQIKKRFNSYCGTLTVGTFKKWLTVYIELRDSYYYGRDIALGELVDLGMQRARASVLSDKPDDFIVKLMDRIDDGTLHYKNKPDIVEKQAGGISDTAAKTIGKVFSALGNVEEPTPPDGELNEYDEEDS